MPHSRNLSGCQVFSPAHLPNDWVCVPLKERLELLYGRALKEEVRKPGDVDVFGSNGKVGSHNEHWLDGPGILVGRKGTVGAVHYTEKSFWPIDTTYYVKPINDDDLRYLYYLLDYLPLKILNAATGVPGLSRRDAYALRGTFPTPDEQAVIARVLDAVDEAIERAREALDAAQALSSSMIHDAVSAGIDQCGKFRQTTGDIDPAFTVTKLGRFPKKWCITTLGKVCTKITDGTHQAVTTSRDGIPFLYVSCVRNGVIDWSRAARISERDYAVISKGRPPIKGAVLYTAVGSYGHAAVVEDDRKFSFQRHMAILYPNPDLDPVFLATWFNSEKGRRWSDILAVGNAQKTVTLTALGKFPIAIPPWKEQVRIRELLEPVNALVSAREKKLLALQQLKKSLMHDLLTGTVRVDHALFKEQP